MFLPVFGIRGYIPMKFITCTHYQVHVTFSRSWV